VGGGTDVTLLGSQNLLYNLMQYAAPIENGLTQHIVGAPGNRCNSPEI